MSVLTGYTATVTADAKQRTVRSLVQGAIAAVLAAVIGVVLPAVRDGIENVDWTNLYYSIGTAATVTILSYVMGNVLPALNENDGTEVPEPAPVPLAAAPEVEADTPEAKAAFVEGNDV